MRRSVDIITALAAAAVLAVPAALTALAVKLTIGGPVIFSQERFGLNEKPFKLYKFRTMSDARGADGRRLPDAQRVTRLGLFMRRWGLDEMPQLYNVLRGDMSLIGPRPLPDANFIPLRAAGASAAIAQRHTVKPGIVSPATTIQRRPDYAHGQTELDFETWRLKIDMDYISDRQKNGVMADVKTLRQCFNIFSMGIDQSTDIYVPPAAKKDASYPENQI